MMYTTDIDNDNDDYDILSSRIMITLKMKIMRLIMMIVMKETLKLKSHLVLPITTTVYRFPIPPEFFLKMWKQEMPSWKISSSVVNRPWTRGLSFLHWEDCGVWRGGIESVQCLPVHVSFGGKIIISVLFLLIYIVCWLLLRFFCIISKGKRDPCTNT